MPELARFDRWALRPQAAPFSGVLSAGRVVAVLAPDAEESSAFVHALTASTRSVRGRIYRQGAAVKVQVPPNLRDTTQEVMRQAAGSQGTSIQISETLVWLELDSHRRRAIHTLAPAELQRLEIALVLLDRQSAIFGLDHSLDSLTAWHLRGIVDRLRDRMREAGSTLVVSTRRLDLAELCDEIFLVDQGRVLAHLSPAEIISGVLPETVEVQCDDASAVLAVAEPFEIRAETTVDGVRFEAKSGQALAARLLTAGYGAVQAVWVQKPTLEKALMAWIDRARAGLELPEPSRESRI